MYRFGPHNRRFTGTKEEWNELKKTTVVPIVRDGTAFVTCPHCGGENQHSTSNGHRACDAAMTYDCPGYTITIS